MMKKAKVARKFKSSGSSAIDMEEERRYWAEQKVAMQCFSVMYCANHVLQAIKLAQKNQALAANDLLTSSGVLEENKADMKRLKKDKKQKKEKKKNKDKKKEKKSKSEKKN